uniref:Uncharacterized protein n=1 Tax=Aegilops tauschii subsp. strangulata TaxID=200361 RepID=A0A453FA44_AEGTS
MTVCVGLDCLVDNHGGFHHHTLGDAALLHTRHTRREVKGQLKWARDRLPMEYLLPSVMIQCRYINYN